MEKSIARNGYQIATPSRGTLAEFDHAFGRLLTDRPLGLIDRRHSSVGWRRPSASRLLAT
jgi:hypothetical protein